MPLLEDISDSTCPSGSPSILLYIRPMSNFPLSVILHVIVRSSPSRSSVLLSSSSTLPFAKAPESTQKKKIVTCI